MRSSRFFSVKFLRIMQCGHVVCVDLWRLALAKSENLSYVWFVRCYRMPTRPWKLTPQRASLKMHSLNGFDESIDLFSIVLLMNGLRRGGLPI